jgi:hypothetical protein
MLPARVGEEEIDSVQTGARQVPHGIPMAFEEETLDHCLGDVTRDAGKAAAALLRTESGQRVGAGTGEAAVELLPKVEATENQVALERERVRRAQRLRKWVPSHAA